MDANEREKFRKTLACIRVHSRLIKPELFSICVNPWQYSAVAWIPACAGMTEKRRQIMKPFSTLAAVIFSILSLAHLLRLFFHWEVIVNGFVVPQWVSAPA